MNCRKLSSKQIIILSEVVVLLKKRHINFITKSNYRKLAIQYLSITHAHPNLGKEWINLSGRPTVT